MLNIKCGNCKQGMRFDETKIALAAAVITCPKCGTKNKVALPPKPTPPASEGTKGFADEGTDVFTEMDANETNDAEMGWLVVHTENLEPKTYPLKMGKNTIGREAESNKGIIDIRLNKSDSYMSRQHCIIEVMQAAKAINYVLYEFKEQPSKNGTWLNGKTYRLKPTDEIYLNDGETIQIGRTKLVLKTKAVARNANDAQNIVGGTAIAKTIVI